MQSLLDRVRNEAPALRESTCLELVEKTLPFLRITADVLIVLELIFANWRSRGTAVNWWTLSYIREVGQRIALPDPAGWVSSKEHQLYPFENPLDLAVAIEGRLSGELKFLLDRYAAETKHDGTMTEIWIEVLIFSSTAQRGKLPEIIRELDQIDDLHPKLYLLSTLCRIFGPLCEVQEFLARKASEAPPGDFALFSRCLLAGANRKVEIADICENIDSKDLLRLCPVPFVIALPDFYFYFIATRIVNVHTQFEYDTFAVIHEGLRRLYGDSREFNLSSTTMAGILEVLVWPGEQRGGADVMIASKQQVEFIKGIYRNREIWSAKTNIWAKYGLVDGRESVRILLTKVLEKYRVLAAILVLLAAHIRLHREPSRSLNGFADWAEARGGAVPNP